MSIEPTRVLIEYPLIVKEKSTHVLEQLPHMALRGKGLQLGQPLQHVILAFLDSLEGHQDDWGALDLSVCKPGIREDPGVGGAALQVTAIDLMHHALRRGPTGELVRAIAVPGIDQVLACGPREFAFLDKLLRKDQAAEERAC